MFGVICLKLANDDSMSLETSFLLFGRLVSPAFAFLHIASNDDASLDCTGLKIKWDL